MSGIFEEIKKIINYFKGDKAESKQDGSINLEEFTCSLEQLYNRFSLRINADRWENLLQQNLTERNQEVVNREMIKFLMEHYNLPTAVWQVLDKHLMWSSKKEILFENYPENFVYFILSNINNEYRLRYDLLDIEEINGGYDEFITAYYRAYFALQDKDLFTAEKAIQEAKQIFEKHLDLIILEAKYCMEVDDVTKALERLDYALSLSQEEISAYFEKGNLYVRVGQLDKAYENYHECLRYMPGHAESKYYLAGCCLDIGKYEEAQHLYNGLLEAYPSNAACLTHLNSVNHFLIDELENKRNLQPLDAKETLALARSYFHFKEYYKCYEMLEQAEATLDLTAETYILLGDCCRYLKRGEEAENFYSKGITIAPQSPELYYKKARLFNDLEAYDKAVACLDTVLSLSPDNEEAYEAKGVNLIALNKNFDAVRCFDHAIAINENNWINYYFKARALIGGYDYEYALECAEQAVRLSGGNQRSYYMKGIALYGMKYYEEAMKNFNWSYNYKEEVKEAPCFYAQIFFYAALTLFKMKDYDEAYRFFDRAIEDDRAFIPAYAGKILILLSNREDPSEQKYDEGIRICFEALQAEENEEELQGQGKECVRLFIEKLSKYIHLIDYKMGYEEIKQSADNLYAYAKRKEKKEM